MFQYILLHTMCHYVDICWYILHPIQYTVYTAYTVHLMLIPRCIIHILNNFFPAEVCMPQSLFRPLTHVLLASGGKWRLSIPVGSRSSLTHFFKAGSAKHAPYCIDFFNKTILDDKFCTWSFHFEVNMLLLHPPYQFLTRCSENIQYIRRVQRPQSLIGANPSNLNSEPANVQIV